MPDCGGGWRAWRPGCPPPVQGAGCRATSRLARGVSRREKSSGKGVPTALPGGGRNPPAGWSTLRSPARNATPPCPGGWVQRAREVIDIPVDPAEVTEHVFMARLCPLRRKRRLPQAPLRGLVVGRQRLGVNLVSLIVTLREEGRLPVRTIQWYLRTFHQLKLSVGAIVRAVHQVARHGGTAVAETLERIRSSPVVHADETGWRENRVNGYVWTFSTPAERYFLRRGRGGEVVDEALGEEFGGILASDFYAAYDHYPGLKQRCWAHLLRDIHKLKALYPEDAVLAKWANGVRWLYDRARAWAAAGGRLPARGELVLERRRS